MSGSLFHDFLDMLGHVWGYFGDVFGWVWEGFEEKLRKCRKVEIFKNAREYFSCAGRNKLSIFSLPPDKKKSNTLFFGLPFFYIFFYFDPGVG